MNLNKRETATVLAALRYFQTQSTKSNLRGSLHFVNEKVDPLTNEQIDRLCERINTDHKPKVLRKPLGKRWKRAVNKDGYLTVTVPVDFNQIVDNDLEGLNDILDSLILGDTVAGSLSDISWHPVGIEKDAVLLEVTTCPEAF